MRLIGLTGFLLSMAPFTPAYAQQHGEGERVILVQGTGTVKTAPDLATIMITVSGEGENAEAAASALSRKQQIVVRDLRSFLKGALKVETGEMSITPTRAGNCQNYGYGNQARLSTGDCAITGYAAVLQSTIRTDNVDDAATAAGLAARSGALNASVSAYGLQKPDQARLNATTAAIADAREQAQTLASGANVRLGDIVQISSPQFSNAREIVVTGQRAAAGPPPPPPPPPPPIPTSPAPIETTVRVNVTYAINQ